MSSKQRSREGSTKRDGSTKRREKDLFIIDTKCELNRALRKRFEKAGYRVKVS